jgi:chemosensory pili system protein ChpA (sensor histidine kinase/response regulator)
MSDNEVDDEIIEIFVEEAGEVLESLDDMLPRWRADLSDRSLLTDIRRSYHTLKGSGRMAKAMELADIAWKVEQALNKALEGSLEVTPTLVDMVTQTRNEFPPLLDCLSQRKPLSLPEGYLPQLLSRIDAVASGATMPASASPPSVSPAPVAAAAMPVVALDALRLELTAARDHAEAAKASADSARARIDAAQAQATAAQARADEALTEARSAAARAAAAEKAVTGLVARSEWERQTAQVQKLQTELAELRAQLKAVADKPAAPQNESKAGLEQRINREITALRAENGRLQNEVSRLLKAVGDSRLDTMRIAGACSLVAFVLAIAASMFLK